MQLRPEDNDPLRARHRNGLHFAGAGVIAARLPIGVAAGRIHQQDPRWRADEVARHPPPGHLSLDRRVGKSDVFHLHEEKREIRLLDDRVFITVRNAFYDSAKRRHFKELAAITPEGTRIPYNSVPKKLMPLDGIEAVLIDGQSDLIIVEGYPAAEALRGRDRQRNV